MNLGLVNWYKAEFDEHIMSNGIVDFRQLIDHKMSGMIMVFALLKNV